MTDALSTLAWKLKSLTGLESYHAPKPVGASMPCITYQAISDPMQDSNQSAGASIHMTRVQVSVIGDFETARPYVNTIQAGLEGNRTDFLACISDGIYLERWEGEDIWSLIKGYYIQWK